MKKNVLLITLLFILPLSALISTNGFAADAQWNGTANTAWDNDANWSAVHPAGTNTATFNNAGNGNTTINLGAGVGFGTLLFDNAACEAYNIGSAAGQTITIANGGAIVVNNGVVKTQTIVGNVNLSPNGTFSNNGANDAFLLNCTGNVTGGAVAGTFILNGSDTGNNNISGIIANGVGALALTKSEAGKWILSGSNTYTGATTISGGTLQIGSGGTTGLLSVNSAITNNAALIFNRTDTITQGTDFASVIGGTGTLTQSGTGILVLNGINTYSGTTTIGAGTIQVSNSDAVGTGALTNNATLDIGTTDLTVGGVYTQGAGSTLKLAANSSSNFGKITSAGNAAVVAAGSTVDVTVGGYIPNNATFTVIDTGGSGIGNTPATITSNNSFVTFSGASSGGNLILTASRSGSGFQGVAANSNAAAVGAVLDNITNPSSDMTTVLNTLSGLSSNQVAASENTFTPIMDGAVTQVSTQVLSQFVDNTVSHLEDAQAGGGNTGISTGDDYFKGLDIWARGLGDYAHQDQRGLSNGYNATTWGISGGADIPIYDNLVRLGLGSGYGQTFVRSKDNAARADIDSVPFMLYAGYQGVGHPVYIDTVFTFNYNMYKSSRQIYVGSTIERTANADYNGQQYSAYFEGGYSFFYKKLRTTPMVSFQYMHLHTASYTETGADALNLNVDSQDYDMAQTGLGIKVAYPFENKSYTLTPDLHFKWLYDWIGDNQATTASFAGGGTSFGTQGFDPAQSGYDLGVRLTLNTKYRITLDLSYDFFLKEDYYEHTGILNVRYSF